MPDGHRPLHRIVRWITHGRPVLPRHVHPDRWEALGWRWEGPSCPECGQMAVSWTEDVETIDVYPLVEMWPGGPVFEDHSRLPTKRIVDRTVTLECGDHTWTPDSPDSLRITLRAPSRWRRLQVRRAGRR